MKTNTPQTILITGATSGIGRELAAQYAQIGVTLLLTGRREALLQELQQALEQKGATVKTAAIDVADRQGMQNWIDEIDAIFPIDLVIANAGQSLTQVLKTEPDIHSAELALLNTHFAGMLNTVLPCLAHMQKRNRGQIAIMSSMNAFVPLGRSCIYGGVKAGVLHYGLALRKKTKRNNVKVSAICPGWVKTPLTDLNTYKMPWRLDLSDGARRIIKGLSSNRAIVAFPWPLRLVIGLGRFFKIIKP